MQDLDPREAAFALKCEDQYAPARICVAPTSKFIRFWAGWKEVQRLSNHKEKGSQGLLQAS